MDINMTEIPEKLRHQLAKHLITLKEERQLGFNQLALKSGVNVSILNKIFKGTNKRINPYQLKKLAYALKIDYKELYKIVEYLDEDNAPPKNINPLEITVIELPVYGATSAGRGAINIANEIRKEKFILLQDESMPKGAFSVEVSGNSMYPTLLDGDIAVIDPNYHKSDLNNEICLVTYEGQEYLKRFSNNKKFINLMNDNPNRSTYKDIIILKTEYTDFKCHGVVIESKRKHHKKINTL